MRPQTLWPAVIINVAAAMLADAGQPCFMEHSLIGLGQYEASSNPPGGEGDGWPVNSCVLPGDSAMSSSLARDSRPGSAVLAGETAATGWQYRLLDVDGRPLPFRDDEQVLEFLRTAEVVSSREIGRGVTKPRKLVLEKDGVRAHAVFRYAHHLERNDKRWKAESFRYIKDSYRNEVAAYELSGLLGLDRVPPVVLRRVNGIAGSVQIWLEDVIMNLDRRDLGLQPPDPARWEQQSQTLLLFDNIAGNLDRNLGNLLIDRGWSAWFIDHSRSFALAREPLYPEAVSRCERGLWQRLQRLDLQTVRDRLAPYLDRWELNTLEARITSMVDHIRRQIAVNGEESVLFDLADPGPPVDTWQTE